MTVNDPYEAAVRAYETPTPHVETRENPSDTPGRIGNAANDSLYLSDAGEDTIPYHAADNSGNANVSQ